MIDFTAIATTPADLRQIHAIAKRAAHELNRDLISTSLDLEACHGVCPLDLAGLLSAHPVNLAHDIGGISRHLNHDTGRLDDEFCPRYAKRQ